MKKKVAPKLWQEVKVKVVGLGVSIFQKYTHSPAKKMRKNQHVKRLRFSLNTN